MTPKTGLQPLGSRAGVSPGYTIPVLPTRRPPNGAKPLNLSAHGCQGEGAGEVLVS